MHFEMGKILGVLKREMYSEDYVVWCSVLPDTMANVLFHQALVIILVFVGLFSTFTN